MTASGSWFSVLGSHRLLLRVAIAGLHQAQRAATDQVKGVGDDWVQAILGGGELTHVRAQNLAAGPVYPIGPTRTGGWLDYFFREDGADVEIEELIAWDDQVGREDRALVASVQRGVSSGLIETGRLMPESERLLAHFQEIVREAPK